MYKQDCAICLKYTEKSCRKSLWRASIDIV